MATNVKKAWRDQKGYALPLVLALVVVGGLMLVPTIGFASSSVRSMHKVDEGIRGRYAADAGVERVIWAARNGQAIPTQLTEPVNGLNVAMEVTSKGRYVLYMGQLVEVTGHIDYLTITGDMVWDEGAQAYKYTVTATWQPQSGTPVVHIREIGAHLPTGFTYVAGSAGGFPSNLSTREPDIVMDVSGVQMVNWVFETPRPSVDRHNPVATQSFYLDGPDEFSGDYSWLVAERTDVHTLSTIAGGLYIINASATRPDNGAVVSRIRADALMADSGMSYILSWEVNK
ncbi:MAG: hypothetical protein HYY29_02155 [Chloroflexi bacterium]|nr:hypothetical protein [Chloroflexota bacterium]